MAEVVPRKGGLRQNADNGHKTEDTKRRPKIEFNSNSSLPSFLCLFGPFVAILLALFISPALTSRLRRGAGHFLLLLHTTCPPASQCVVTGALGSGSACLQRRRPEMSARAGCAALLVDEHSRRPSRHRHRKQQAPADLRGRGMLPAPRTAVPPADARRPCGYGRRRRRRAWL